MGTSRSTATFGALLCRHGAGGPPSLVRSRGDGAERAPDGNGAGSLGPRRDGRGGCRRAAPPAVHPSGGVLGAGLDKRGPEQAGCHDWPDPSLTASWARDQLTASILRVLRSPP